MIDLTTPFIAVGLVLTVLLTLDLIERYKTKTNTYQNEKLKIESAFFYLFVILIFFIIMRGGFYFLTADFYFGLFDKASEITINLLNISSSGDTLTGLRLYIFIILSLYVAGFWDYLFHRFISHSKLFWFTHEYHHLPNQVFVGAPGIFARPFSVFILLPNIVITIFSMTFIYGLIFRTIIDLKPLVFVVFLQGLIAIINHSSYLRNFIIIHKVMKFFGLTSPQEHVLHHTTDLKGNYSNFTTIWDRIFSTYLDPYEINVSDKKLGLAYDRDFFQTISLGLIKIPINLRKRFQVYRYCNIDREKNSNE